MRDGDENNNRLSQWPPDDHSYSISVILQCQALGGAQGQSACLTCARSWAPSPALKKREEIEARFCEGQHNGCPHCPVSVHTLLDARPTVPNKIHRTAPVYLSELAAPAEDPWIYTSLYRFPSSGNIARNIELRKGNGSWSSRVNLGLKQKQSWLSPHLQKQWMKKEKKKHTSVLREAFAVLMISWFIWH